MVPSLLRKEHLLAYHAFQPGGKHFEELMRLLNKLKPFLNLNKIKMQQHKDPLRLQSKEKPVCKRNTGEHHGLGYLRYMPRDKAY